MCVLMCGLVVSSFVFFFVGVYMCMVGTTTGGGWMRWVGEMQKGMWSGMSSHRVAVGLLAVTLKRTVVSVVVCWFMLR